MSDDEIKPVKMAKKILKHERTIFLIDVGSNMADVCPDSNASFLDVAKEILDWIITRKIFAKSSDEFAVMLFGCECDSISFPVFSDKNIRFCIEKLQTAKIEWLKLFEKEIQISINTKGDYISALTEAVNYIRCLSYLDQTDLKARNLLLISNLAGYPIGSSEIDPARIENIVNSIKTCGISLNVVGPPVKFYKCEYTKNETDGSKMVLNETENGLKLVSSIVQQVNGVIYSFTEVLPMLQKFIRRQTNIRGQKFLLELGENIKLPLYLFKKVQEMDMKFNFEKFDESTKVKLKKETIFEKIVDTDCIPSSKVDAKFQQSKKIIQLKKEETVKGYCFGTSVISFNEADQKVYGWARESRSMKLMQFVKSSEILQHYLMDGGVYYCLPPVDDEDGSTMISSLVNAMIIEESVALVRFVFNGVSFPRIMALFPRISKKGAPIFVGIALPFYDDFRGLEFPSFEEEQFKPTYEQVCVVEAFVSSMDLTKYQISNSGEYIESLRPRDVSNPKLQRICEAVKHRAFNPDDPLLIPSSKILDDLKPRPMLLKFASESILLMKKKFRVYELTQKKWTEKNEDDSTDL